MDKTYTITLADGTELTNLGLNGNNFISETKIDDSVFEGNLEVVTIYDSVTEQTQVMHHADLVQNIKYEDEYWFILREKTAEELAFESILKTLQEQSAKIVELEEAVFPIENTSFEMLITSLMAVDLDLYDSNDEIVPNMGLSTEVWDEPTELVYQNEVRKGTYYLKNSDGYALGKPNGEIQPLVCEGGTVSLGNVEVIMLQPPNAKK